MSTATTTTVNISMPEVIRQVMKNRMAASGYENASEYVRHLIREDLKRAEEEKLDAMLIEAEQTGETHVADKAWWAKLRQELTEKVHKAKRQ